MGRVMRKPAFLHIPAKTKTQISCASTISAFAFAISPSTSKFEVYSHLMWLYSPVCVGPGRKLRSCFFFLATKLVLSIINLVSEGAGLFESHHVRKKRRQIFYRDETEKHVFEMRYFGLVTNEPRREKTLSSGFPTTSDTNRTVQAQA